MKFYHNMKKNKIICICLLILGIQVSIQTSYSQSAIGQLESMTGQKINRSSSAAANTQMNTMITTTIMQSVLSSIFDGNNSAPRVQQVTSSKATLTTNFYGEQEQIRNALAQAKYDKLIKNSQFLARDQTIKIRNFDEIVALNNSKSVIDPTNLKSVTPIKSLHASIVPPLPASQAISADGHPYIDLSLALTKVAVGELVPNKLVAFGLNAGFTLIAEDLKAISDVYNNKPCPSTSTILKNTLNQLVGDTQEGTEGYVNDKALSLAKNIGFKGGIKPINIQRAVKTVEWVQKGGEIKDMFQKGMDVGNDLNTKF